MFDGGDVGMIFARHRREGGHVEIDGDGGEDGQKPEQADQLEAASPGDGDRIGGGGDGS